MDRSVLQKAVRPDSEPTPGYLLEEIVRMSMLPGACGEIEEFLLKGLGQNYKQYDPYVKGKMLRIVKHICDAGNPQFRLSLQRKVGTFKAFLCYRSPPDPLRGDALNRDVRDMAQKCIKALYGNETFDEQQQVKSSQFYLYEEPSAQTGPTSGWQASSSRIEGFGSEFNPIGENNSCRSESQFTTFRRSGKMEGFGNPHFAYHNDNLKGSGAPSVVDSVSEVVSAQAENLVNGLSQAASTVSRYLPDSVKAQIDAIGHKLALPSSRSGNVASSNDEWSNRNSVSDHYRFSGVPGGRQRQPTDSSLPTYSPPREQQSHPFFRPLPSIPKSAEELPVMNPRISFVEQTQTQVPETVSEDHGSKNNDVQFYSLISSVEEICLSTISSRPAPTRSALAEFVKSVSSDSQSSMIIPILLSKLNPNLPIGLSIRPATTWQAKYRVISCISALVDPAFNLNPDTRVSFERTLKKLGRDTLMTVCATTPKCRKLAEDLIRNIQLSPNPSQPAPLADFLVGPSTGHSLYDDDSVTSDSSSSAERLAASTDLWSGGGAEQSITSNFVGNNDLLGDLLPTPDNEKILPVSSPTATIESVLGPGSLLDDDVVVSKEGATHEIIPDSIFEQLSCFDKSNSLAPSASSSLFSGLSISNGKRGVPSNAEKTCQSLQPSSAKLCDIAWKEQFVLSPMKMPADASFTPLPNFFPPCPPAPSGTTASRMSSSALSRLNGFELRENNSKARSGGLFHFVQ